MSSESTACSRGFFTAVVGQVGDQRRESRRKAHHVWVPPLASSEQRGVWLLLFVPLANRRSLRLMEARF